MCGRTLFPTHYSQERQDNRKFKIQNSRFKISEKQWLVPCGLWFEKQSEVRGPGSGGLARGETLRFWHKAKAMGRTRGVNRRGSLELGQPAVGVYLCVPAYMRMDKRRLSR